MTTLAGTATAVSSVAEEAEPSIYLTDGLRLLRLARGSSWPPETSFVVLEDCRTLAERPYSREEIAALRLSVVSTSPAATA